MKDRRKISGQWWSPKTPSEQWMGVLTLAPNKNPRLRLTIPKEFGEKVEASPIVLQGIDPHGAPITLLFPLRRKISQSAVLSRITFSAGYALLGIHVNEPAEVSFNSLIIRLQHLQEWSGITGFLQPERGTSRDANIRFHRPDDQSFAIDSDLSVNLISTYTSQVRLREQNVREDFCVEFTSKRGLNLPQCMDLLKAFRHLLHFAVLEPVFPLEIIGEREGHGVALGELFVPHRIELYGELIKEPVESELFHERWIFRFEDLQQNFGGFMAEWLKYVKSYDEAIGCYMTRVYHRLPHEVEHLCLTQALDAYHGNKYASHADRVFEDKVRELAEPNATALKGIIDDVADFATTVVHNRNYYTHHNPKWKQDGRVVSGAKLHRLNEKLRLIFQMCLLRDIGISADRFPRLRRQLASQIIEYT